MAATSDNQTLARPYARAVFEMAQAAGTLDQWSASLNALGQVVSQDDVKGLIGNPGVDQDALAGHIAAIANADSTEAGNLLKLLAENKRMDLLSAIAEQFDVLKAAAEGWLEVEVTAATEVDEGFKSRLSDALSHRLGREIRLETSQDESLVGGAVIRAGDLVIDGSVRSQLERMQQALT